MKTLSFTLDKKSHLRPSTLTVSDVPCVRRKGTVTDKGEDSGHRDQGETPQGKGGVETLLGMTSWHSLHLKLGPSVVGRRCKVG